MSLKLNKDGFVAKLVLNSYQTDVLPKSICPFFWKIVFAILALPFQWIIVLYNWKINRTNDKMSMFGGVVAGTLIQLVTLILVLYAYEKPYEASMRGLILIGVLVAIGIVLFLIYIIEDNWHEIIDFFTKNKNGDNTKVGVFTEYVSANKSKICPPIEWTSKTDKNEQ